MALSDEDKDRLVGAYKDHMKVHHDFEHPRTGTQEEWESTQRRYHETEERLERLADEIGVQPEDYPELEQMLGQELEGPSIGD